MLVGIDDGWAGMADPPDVPDTGAYTLYMIHEPDCRADWDADLILAGHTHGGQFLPQNTPVPGFELSGLVGEKRGEHVHNPGDRDIEPRRGTPALCDTRDRGDQS